MYTLNTFPSSPPPPPPFRATLIATNAQHTVTIKRGDSMETSEHAGSMCVYVHTQKYNIYIIKTSTYNYIESNGIFLGTNTTHYMYYILVYW